MIVLACLPTMVTTTTAAAKFITAHKPCATRTHTICQSGSPVSLHLQGLQGNTQISEPIAVSTTWQIEGTMHGNWNG